jgi:hypothetical protein
MVDPEKKVAALDRHVTKHHFLTATTTPLLAAPLERTELATSVAVYARMASLDLHVSLKRSPIAE